MHRDWLLIELRTDWYHRLRDVPRRARCWPPTTTNSFPALRELQVVFEPDAHTCLTSYAWTRDKLVLVTLADVASRVEIVTPGSWRREPVPGIPADTNTVIVDARRARRRNLLRFKRIRHSVAAAVRARPAPN